MKKDELINILKSNYFINLYTKIEYLIKNDQFKRVKYLDIILKTLPNDNLEYIQLDEYTIIFDKKTDTIIDLCYTDKENGCDYLIPKEAYRILNRDSYLPLKQMMISHDLVLKINEIKEEYPESDPFDILFKDHYIFIEDIWTNGYFYRMVKYGILDDSLTSEDTVHFTDTKKYKEYINQQQESSNTYPMVVKLLDALSDKEAKEE